MDLTRPVTYRTVNINDAVVQDGGLIVGNQITNTEYYGVEAIGYREKRSASDGLDASDVYLGGRTVRISGATYGDTRADFFDRLNDLRAAFSPTSAYLESPGDYGYLPLEFEVPTEDITNWPSGFITQMVRVRPMGTPRVVFQRDRVGGSDTRGFSAEWEQFFEAKDPRIYAQDETITYFNAAGNTSSGAGTLNNRGPYPAPVNILIYLPASVTGERRTTLTVGGSSIKIVIPASTNARTARYDGTEKTLTLEESGVELLRMDLLTFPAGVDHPLIPSGSSSYSWENRDGTNTLANIRAESRFWFWEAWT
jgi:hypothetical protein